MKATPFFDEELGGLPLGELRAALLAHYDRHRRDVPWRDESDPYRVLVSEVMLQQTRVETVALRYAGWLERFPDIQTLAAADEDEVLKAWEGLGYYRRARNLHRTAVLVRERPDVSLPSAYAALRELPGLGDYTAGAVASIAFGEPVAAVDGNVRRVLARLLDRPRPKPAWLRGVASMLVDPRRPGDWNQAMMELGATVCSPRSPRCAECPVAPWCASRAAGTQRDRPARSERRAPRAVTLALAVLHTGDRALLERRPRGGLLGGMWAFPEREAAGPARAPEAVLELAAERGLSPASEPVPLPTCSHRFTHLRATYLPWALEVECAGGRDDRVWVDVWRPTRLALPVAQQRVLVSFGRTRSGAPG